MCGSSACKTIYVRNLRGRIWGLALCGECGLHFTVPQPSEADLISFYEGAYHTELMAEGASEAAFGEKYQRYANALGRHLSCGRVVDVGCSTGLLVRILKDRGY